MMLAKDLHRFNQMQAILSSGKQDAKNGTLATEVVPALCNQLYGKTDVCRKISKLYGGAWVLRTPVDVINGQASLEDSVPFGTAFTAWSPGSLGATGLV